MRLPAHLTANGRAILAHTSEAQLRALFSRPGDLTTRTGRGPRSLPELTGELAREQERGWSQEVELVSQGFRSMGWRRSTTTSGRSPRSAPPGAATTAGTTPRRSARPWRRARPG
ncbi:hypothetical protein O1L60_04615 [Streptomyces diastatochromogenes]|nr:hypothetical protein [Streptomyces diastatochromogenes]